MRLRGAGEKDGHETRRHGALAGQWNNCGIEITEKGHGDNVNLPWRTILLYKCKKDNYHAPMVRGISMMEKEQNIKMVNWNGKNRNYSKLQMRKGKDDRSAPYSHGARESQG